MTPGADKTQLWKNYKLTIHHVIVNLFKFFAFTHYNALVVEHFQIIRILPEPGIEFTHPGIGTNFFFNYLNPLCNSALKVVP